MHIVVEVEMVALRTEQNVQDNEPGSGVTGDSKIFLLFLGLLVVGGTGYFALRDLGLDSLFAHVGGLGIIGLFAALTGFIARKKGYGYRDAFLLGFGLPILLGVISVLLVDAMSCGGSVSLGVALLVVIIYSLAKRRDALRGAES
jgi:hypothetical protein